MSINPEEEINVDDIVFEEEKEDNPIHKQEVQHIQNPAIDTAVEPKSYDIQQIEIETKRVTLDKARAANSQTVFINPIAFEQIKQVANVLIKDGAISPDVKNSSQMIMKLQAGFEMNMKMTESLSSLYIVNGKVTIYGSAVTGRVRGGGWSIAYQEGGELNHEFCKAFVYKGGKPRYDEEFNFVGFKPEDFPDEIYAETLTFEEAKSSDGGNGPGWKPGRNRKLKLRYGALASILKTYLPELLNGASDITEAADDFRDTKEDIALRISKAKENKEMPQFEAKPVITKNAK